jgi:hypothetical protein
MPTLWRFSIAILKFSLFFAMKRESKGDKINPFWKPANKSFKRERDKRGVEILI